MWCKSFLKECMVRLQISHVSISNGSTEQCYCQIYCKNWWSDRVFYVTIADADIWSPYISLISICIACLWNLNKIVCSEFNQIWSVLIIIITKMVNNYWQSVDAILEDMSVAETMFDAKLLIQRLPCFSVPKVKVVRHCVIRLKVAPNMADLTGLKENRLLL